MLVTILVKGAQNQQIKQHVTNVKRVKVEFLMQRLLNVNAMNLDFSQLLINYNVVFATQHVRNVQMIQDLVVLNAMAQ